MGRLLQLERDYVTEISTVLEHTTKATVKPEVITEYIEKWKTAKGLWIKRFRDSTIYTIPDPVVCELNEEEKTKLIDKFLLDVEPLIPTSVAFGHFKKFVKEQGISAASNIVSKEFMLPQGQIIPKGMKLLRAFKYFFEDKELLTTVQDAMNLVISKCKFSGYLHLSVDPLDYLTISENNYGWRSCHALDGDYVAGNLEYMMDNATIICYIDDNTQVQLHSFPEGLKWNNKKWRMLLFCSEDGETIFAGRQYPSPVLTDALWDLLRQLMRRMFIRVYYGAWEDTYIMPEDTQTFKCPLRQRHIVSEFDGVVYPLSSLYGNVNPRKKLFYDDVLFSTVYKTPYYLFGNSLNTPDCRTRKPVITGVESVTCPHCGKNAIKGDTDSIWCSDCYEVIEDDGSSYTCECCGRHYLEANEGAWLVDDSWWCDRCITDNAVTCAQCGGLCNIENAYYDEKREDYICNYCKEDGEWQ